MPVPNPTPILRLIHLDNLEICLKRGGMYAWNHTPDDNLTWHTIHSQDIQEKRHRAQIPCGPGGVIHDYVPFYFGHLSPMMLKLHTGQVEGYTETQDPLIYLIAIAQAVVEANYGFVFSDGHGLVGFTSWYSDLKNLGEVDWKLVYEMYWRNTDRDMDRKRRKQAEFLIHKYCGWDLIDCIVVINEDMKRQVESVLERYPASQQKTVQINRSWYYN